MKKIVCLFIASLLHISMALASTYNLRVEVTPHGAGTLNANGGNYEESSSLYLRTYSNTGFVFKGWYEGDSLLSLSTSFYYTMPAYDVTVQARYEYNPSVPGNPAMPDTTTYYAFTATISPEGAGSLNLYSGKYAAGQSVSLRAYTNTGYYFSAWKNESGETLSTSSSYTYTMPNQDTHLVAAYTYNPSVPANPDTVVPKYTVSVSCEPLGGGTFNTSYTTVEKGGNVRLYAYANTGFVFQYWKNEAGDTISTAQNFYYTIPEQDSKVIGVFRYNPAPPSNPNKNYWNPETGEVIADDFSAGSLYSAITQAINGNSLSDVSMITVAGRINDNDFGIANNFSNCTLLDLSRVTGVTEVPSYAFDGTNIETIYLPSTIEHIGSYAFDGCSLLSSITCYATTPPTLGSYVFRNIPEGLVVYVPASVIPQYQEADRWKNFTILPIQNDIRSITVNLPDNVNASDFKQMWLELTNVKSGQRLHYIMTERSIYTFYNLIHHTTWNIQLRNEAGDVFGKIENVEVADNDTSVTFTSLQKPQSVTLSVRTPEGVDVTNKVTITWTNSDGVYQAKSSFLNMQIAGKPLNYSIQLPQDLAMQYVLPQPTEYVVKPDSNSIVYTLDTLSSVAIEGKIIDNQYRQAIHNVSVVASLTYAGKYTHTIETKTDKEGLYQINIPKVATVLSFASNGYVSQTINCDSIVLNATDTIRMDDIALKSISGAVLNLNYKYISCPNANGEVETQNWYNDYNNVQYTLYNITKQRTITQFNVQYPQIVLLEEVEDNDQLQITATSKNNAFMPVDTLVTIQGQKANVTFDIYELGQIQASYDNSTNQQVVGILYAENGELTKSYTYNDTQLAIKNLTDGIYTLISMGYNPMLNGMYHLEQYAEIGLIEGNDYVKHTVEVKSGIIATVSIATVPQLDESKFNYTGENTSFTVNKPSIVAGNYLTLTGKINFKTEYANKVSNVHLVVDLPESCSFVENSVMVGNSISSYVLNGSRLSIPMTRHTDRVRFCVIPTRGGQYAPSTSVQFDINQETITQPIGAANYEVKDLSITVPSVVAKTTVPVTGTAIGKSKVEIFDNDTKIGETTALANGVWSITCELNEPYNLSMHKFYAKVTTRSGMELISETKQVMYDVNMIVPEKVTMLYYNPEYVGQYNIVFDLINKTVLPESYYFFPYKSYPNWQGSGTEPKDFTFIADLSNNDSTAVDGVTIRVYTSNGYWRNLEAQYNTSMNRWVAVSQFVEEEAPVGVDVIFSSLREIVLDDSYLQNEYSWLNSFENMTVEVDSIIAEKDEYEDWSDEDFLNYLHNLQDSTLEIEEYDCKGLNEYTIVAEDGRTITVKMISCSGLEESSVASDEEYINILKSSGESLYVKRTESFADYIDFENNVRMTLLIEGNENIVRSRKRAIDGNSIIEVAGYISDLADLINTIDDQTRVLRNALENLSLGYNMDYATAMKGYEKYKNIVKVLEKRYLNPINSNWANIWAIELNGAYGMKNMYYDAARNALKSINCIKAVLNKLSKIGFIDNAKEGYDAMVEWRDILINLQDNDCPGADELYAKAVSYTRRIFAFYYSAASADLASVISLKGKLTGVISLALLNISIHSSNWGKWMHNQWTHEIRMKTPTLKCNDKCPICGKNPCECPDKCPICGKNPCECKPPYPQINPIHDPSGYVYEAVSSNRLEGVTATCYYKETVEDMYGDLHENIVKWNAEEYAQENPLFTDENGMYRWDVPQGLWQVKFEKEGYETTYSDWLPVPPPQLEVNIAMKQNVQPNVQAVRAYEDAIEIQFDKYMLPELLTTENIIVMADTSIIAGSIQLMNEEIAYEGLTDKYVSHVRFNAADTFATEEITLLVKNRIKSYAGIRMQDDFTQSFTIQQEIKNIVCDSLITVIYGEEKNINVQVLPASAVAGKTLRVKSSSPMLLEADTTIVLDQEGKAVITILGEMLGSASIQLTLDDYDISASSIVKIVDRSNFIVAMPIASIESGSTIQEGTTIALSCGTENAMIYYTTDGSIPCDTTKSSSQYNGQPIVINHNTTLKAIAYVDTYESEIATFHYTVLLNPVDTTICANESVLWNGVEYASTGVYVDTLDTGIATLHLTTLPEAIVEGDELAICPSELPYKWHGIEIEEEGNYTTSVQFSSTDCDSIIYNLAVIVQDEYNLMINSEDTLKGNISVGAWPTCPENIAEFEAIPNEGYLFSHWSDGNQENPRTLVLTQDTIVTAIFKGNIVDCDSITSILSLGTWDNQIKPTDDWYEIYCAEAKENGQEYRMIIINSSSENITLSLDAYDSCEATQTAFSYAMNLAPEEVKVLPFDCSSFDMSCYLHAVSTGDVLIEMVPTDCGENLYWDYQEGHLSISGFGDMYDYVFFLKTAPWSSLPIEQISLPATITSIGNWAFFMNNISSIDIPASVTKIGDAAFGFSADLQSITIPEAVSHIGIFAFIGCYNMNSIMIDESNTNFDSRDNSNAIIYTAADSLIVGCKTTIIPESITKIGVGAFSAGMDVLDDTIIIPEYLDTMHLAIHIPNSVKEIAEGAFMYSYFDTLYMESLTPPIIDTTTFNTNPICFVPCGALNAYQHSDWATYMESIEEYTQTQYAEETVTACDSYTWNGETYTESGEYIYTTVAANGCDSIVTLHLTINNTQYAEESVVACDSYTWNGETYTQGGEYTYTTTAANGCDSIVTLHLTINNSEIGATEYVTICYGETYTWNGQTYSTEGEYSVTLSNTLGCDSVATLQLTIMPEAVTTTEAVVIGSDELPYTWRGNTYSATGRYTVIEQYTTVACDSAIHVLDLTVLTTGNHDEQSVTICETEAPYIWYGESYSATGKYTYTEKYVGTDIDSIQHILNLTVNPTVYTEEHMTACDSYEWNGQTYTQSGEYVYTTVAANGCDSIVTLHLTINNTQYAEESVIACDSYVWNGETYTASGEYVYTTTAANGCDSIVTLHLTINQTQYAEEFVIACDSYAWNGETYTESGDYVYTTTAANGCDSIVTLHLTINQTQYAEESVIACDSYAWNGETYTQSGDYTYTTTAANGCDSIVTLHLTINNSEIGATEYVTICYGETYTWNGQTYSTEGEYSITLSNTLGCDSVATLHLTIMPEAVTTTETVVIGSDELPYTWRGNTYSATGRYTVVEQYTTVACDSAIHVLDLTVLTTGNHDEQSVTICETEAPYTWYGESYSATGKYTYTEKYVGTDIDSIQHILNLTVNPTVYTEEHITACDSYTWNGETYTQSGDYTFTTVAANGCDSIVTLHLTINNTRYAEESVTACDSYTWNGETYTESGEYIYATTASNGCDSIVTLHLTINNTRYAEESVTACDSYTWNGETYTESGEYVYTTTATNGCDSIVTLHLTINQTQYAEESIIACDSYVWNGDTYTQSGEYVYTTTATNGCDSIVTLHLTINNTQYAEESVVACNSYTWNGETYTQGGEYVYTTVAANGCDSIVTLHLTINQTQYAEETVIACDSYVWNGETYTQSGDYTYTTTAANGCDSIVTLHLTINQTQYAEETVVACDSYAWNGETYTESGDYVYTTTAANGCDSIVTLHLTINNTQYAEESVVACDSYTWNGETYITSGEYVYTTTAANGCDSIVTLHLTINNTRYAEESVTACDSYTWNGETYTESGEYIYTTVAANGCDSIVTLHLTINNTQYAEESVVACDSYTWNGETYTQGGEYVYTTVAANGCDSIVTLHLTINQTQYTEETVSACDSYAWNGQTYTESGDYTYTTTAANGCDSIVTLHLTINQSEHVEFSMTACDSYTWNGETYTLSGDYTYNTTTEQGCERVEVLHLTINKSEYVEESVTACDSYEWNGVVYTESGDYTYTTTTDQGCERVEVLHLTINKSEYVETSVTACDSYEWNGVVYTESGDYTYNATTDQGCERVEVLHLTINKSEYVETSVTACDSYEWHGMTYTISGDYTYNTTTDQGCERVEVLHLTILPDAMTESEELALCPSELPYEWYGQWLTEAGSYTATEQYAGMECDSVIHELTVNVYVQTLPAAVTLPIVRTGEAIDVSIPTAEIQAHIAAETWYAPNAEVAWYIMENSDWAALTTEPVATGTTQVVLKYAIATDCGNIESDNMVINVIPTSVENTHTQSPTSDCQKILYEDHIYILRDGKTYTIMGAEVK